MLLAIAAWIRPGAVNADQFTLGDKNHSDSPSTGVSQWMSHSASCWHPVQFLCAPAAFTKNIYLAQLEEFSLWMDKKGKILFFL